MADKYLYSFTIKNNALYTTELKIIKQTPTEYIVENPNEGHYKQHISKAVLGEKIGTRVVFDSNNIKKATRIFKKYYEEKLEITEMKKLQIKEILNNLSDTDKTKTTVQQDIKDFINI